MPLLGSVGLGWCNGLVFFGSSAAVDGGGWVGEATVVIMVVLLLGLLSLLGLLPVAATSATEGQTKRKGRTDTLNNGNLGVRGSIIGGDTSDIFHLMTIPVIVRVALLQEHHEFRLGLGGSSC